MTWLFRFTPAAGLSVVGVLPAPRSLKFPYTLANGYYPLSPWAGLAVVCVYAIAALAAYPPRPEAHDRGITCRVDQAAHLHQHRLASRPGSHLTVAVSVAVAAATHESPGSSGGQDPTGLALVGIDLGQVVLAVLAVLMISGEYATA